MGNDSNEKWENTKGRARAETRGAFPATKIARRRA